MVNSKQSEELNLYSFIVWKLWELQFGFMDWTEVSKSYSKFWNSENLTKTKWLISFKTLDHRMCFVNLRERIYKVCLRARVRILCCLILSKLNLMVSIRHWITINIFLIQDFLIWRIYTLITSITRLIDSYNSIKHGFL